MKLQIAAPLCAFSELCMIVQKKMMNSIKNIKDIFKVVLGGFMPLLISMEFVLHVYEIC